MAAKSSYTYYVKMKVDSSCTVGGLYTNTAALFAEGAELCRDSADIRLNVLTSLTIKKLGCSSLDENQSFIFTVVGPDDSTIDVVIKGNGSVTINGLKIGTYTVIENTDWSWRYTPVDSEKEITLKADGNEITFTNNRTEPYWLSGDCLAENRWNGNSSNVQLIARKEEEENENGN